jgi:hypothetical protein
MVPGIRRDDPWIPVFTGMTIMMPSCLYAHGRPDFQTIDISTPDHWPIISQIFTSPEGEGFPPSPKETLKGEIREILNTFHPPFPFIKGMEDFFISGIGHDDLSPPPAFPASVQPSPDFAQALCRSGAGEAGTRKISICRSSNVFNPLLTLTLTLPLLFF